MTDVANKWAFLVEICSLQGVVNSSLKLFSVSAMSGTPVPCNSLLATDHLQWWTSDANYICHVVSHESERNSELNGEKHVRVR